MLWVLKVYQTQLGLSSSSYPQPMPNPKITKLKELLKLVDDGLTKADFNKSFEAVLQHLLKLEQKLGVLWFYNMLFDIQSASCHKCTEMIKILD